MKPAQNADSLRMGMVVLHEIEIDPGLGHFCLFVNLGKEASVIAEFLRLYQFDFGYGERGDLHAFILSMGVGDPSGYSMRFQTGTTD